MSQQVLNKNVSGVKYINLLFSIKKNARYVSLVLRDSMHMTPPIQKFLTTFAKNLVEKRKTSEWPGTKLEGEGATLFMFQLTEDLWKEILNAHCFNNWIYPMRLEDPCFYDQDKNLILGSVSHQNNIFYSEKTA